MIGIHYKLFDIYTLHIKEVDMNKNSNVIYQLRNYMSRRRQEQNNLYLLFFFLYKNFYNMVKSHFIFILFLC